MLIRGDLPLCISSGPALSQSQRFYSELAVRFPSGRKNTFVTPSLATVRRLQYSCGGPTRTKPAGAGGGGPEHVTPAGSDIGTDHHMSSCLASISCGLYFP